MARKSVSDGHKRGEVSTPSDSVMSMMRIAVAGTGGLARLIAHFVQQDTGHHVVLLSREVSFNDTHTYRVPITLSTAQHSHMLLYASARPQTMRYHWEGFKYILTSR